MRVVTGVDSTAHGYNIPGVGIHRELALLVAAGLTPADAIRAATVNSAEMVGGGAVLGQIRAGFHADLFAVEGDPLQKIDDLQRIKLIVRAGEVLERQDLLTQARHAARVGHRVARQAFAISHALRTWRSSVRRLPTASRSVYRPFNLVCERNTSPVAFIASSRR